MCRPPPLPGSKFSLNGNRNTCRNSSRCTNFYLEICFLYPVYATLELFDFSFFPSAIFPKKSKALLINSDINIHSAVPNPTSHLDIMGQLSKLTQSDDTVAEAEHLLTWVHITWVMWTQYHKSKNPTFSLLRSLFLCERRYSNPSTNPRPLFRMISSYLVHVKQPLTRRLCQKKTTKSNSVSF